jgi:hypothetical protein
LKWPDQFGLLMVSRDGIRRCNSTTEKSDEQQAP